MKHFLSNRINRITIINIIIVMMILIKTIITLFFIFRCHVIKKTFLQYVAYCRLPLHVSLRKIKSLIDILLFHAWKNISFQLIINH